MNSPYSDKPMELQFKQDEFTFKGEKFTVTVLQYYCYECNEYFTTNELDTLTLYQVYWQYANKHGLPLEEVMPKPKEE